MGPRPGVRGPVGDDLRARIDGDFERVSTAHGLPDPASDGHGDRARPDSLRPSIARDPVTRDGGGGSRETRVPRRRVRRRSVDGVSARAVGAAPPDPEPAFASW